MIAAQAAELLTVIAPAVVDVSIQLVERARLQTACTKLLRQYRNVECCRRCDPEHCVPCRVIGEEDSLSSQEFEAIAAALERCRDGEHGASR